MTINLLKRYRNSPNYTLSALEEFDDQEGSGAGRKYHYGVVFSIRNVATRKFMYTHYHVHYDRNWTDVSAHFKEGMGKGAAQSLDITPVEARLFTGLLRRSGITANWTAI
jgi:hypothetical protein